VTECIIILPEKQREELDLLKKTNNLVIGSINPRLDYAYKLQFILQYHNNCNLQETTCFSSNIGKNSIIGIDTFVGYNVVIGDNVTIGKGCIIKSGAIINDNVIIGDCSIIRENAVIGGYGFGFERDEGGIPVRIPHVGGAVIGEKVEIGALTTVASGTVEPTVIEDYVKVDDHVHIAHNCHIGKGCIITACAEISGSVIIGDKTWLGPNCSIINGIKIGKNCTIGIGAVVKKSVMDNSVVTGDPARPLKSIIKEKEMFNILLSAYESGKMDF
jgi:UDP-3-O-[3-hydroxymyristoyl] glucosamine N-acyltransferase LpxD